MNIYKLELVLQPMSHASSPPASSCTLGFHMWAEHEADRLHSVLINIMSKHLWLRLKKRKTSRDVSKATGIAVTFCSVTPERNPQTYSNDKQTDQLTQVF